MGIITTKDGTIIYYKDWGTGQPVVFSHSWPLNSDVWDEQMLFVASNGYRAIAYDRRGYGRSSQSWNGNDMDTYASDLSELTEMLDLHNAVLVGHSMGGGEVTRYIGRYGTSRLARVVLVSTISPLTAANPDSQPIEVFDQIRVAVTMDRSQFYKDLSVSFYGANRPESRVSQGTLDMFWLWSMQAGLKNVFDSIKVFSETDLTEDLKKIDIPTMIIHGDDDQIVPVRGAPLLISKIVKNAVLKIYPGAPHGLPNTHKDQFNEDLLSFLRA